MFPVHRGLYAPRSTMHQFAKPGCMTFSPFPANSIDPNQSFHSHKSPEGMQSSMSSGDFFDTDISTPKESSLGQAPPYTKKPQSKAERRAEHNAIERARMSPSYWNQNHIPQAYNPLFTPPNNN